MGATRLIIVTGLPGAGKSTLARELARALHVTLLGKDMIKEPLLDVLGAGDRSHSRHLSDASFAVLFALARTVLAQGMNSLILEGNFRSAEHEPAILQLLPPGAQPRSAITQVLCRLAEPARLARLGLRTSDPARHPGHRDGELRANRPADGGIFLDLPGRRIALDTDGPAARCTEFASQLAAALHTP